jgi:hypothetical protein
MSNTTTSNIPYTIITTAGDVVINFNDEHESSTDNSSTTCFNKMSDCCGEFVDTCCCSISKGRCCCDSDPVKCLCILIVIIFIFVLCLPTLYN